MNIIVVIVASIFGLLLGLNVLIRDFKQSYARFFALVSVFVVVWVIANFFTSNYFGSGTVLRVANMVAYVSGYLAIASGLIFTYHFPVRREVSRREIASVSILIVATILIAPTYLVAGVPQIYEGAVVYNAGPLILLYAVSFLVLLALVTKNLFKLSSGVSQQKRLQARQVLVAFLISAVLGFVVNVILPMLGFGWGWTGLSPLTIIPLVGIIAYSIVRHGLFDMRLTATRLATFILVFGIFFGVSYGVLSVVSEIDLFGAIGQPGKNAIYILTISLLTILGYKTANSVETFLGRLLLKNSYDSTSLSESISRLVLTSVGMQQLLDNSIYHIVRALNATSAVMVVRSSDSAVYSASYGNEVAVDTFLLDIINGVDKIPTPVLVEYMQESRERTLLGRLGVALYVPFVYDDTLIGFLGLSEREKGGYSDRDIRVLSAVSTELAVAMQNSLYAQRIHGFNESLKNEVERATTELRASNLKLKQIDQVKDEFISLTSHQLRTPLTTVKGYISMLLDGDAGELKPQQRKFLEEAFNSSQRMTHLISDFLNISRIQTGKFMVELVDTNLADVLNEEIEQLHIGAVSRQLNLRYDRPVNFPIIPTDEGKIRQVMMNFIDNAIYYSPAGSTINVILSYTASTIEFKVVDQGIGVPKSEQHRLFAKFSRASNAREQRPDGTGIGLFMAKKVIVALGGAIIFESEEGKGSTFGFRLNRPKA